MKICPKCGSEHNKQGIFCSRVCANSRQWTVEDRIKKSVAAKESVKLKEMWTPERRMQVSEALKRRYKGVDIPFHVLTDLERARGLETRKSRYTTNRETADYRDRKVYRRLCQFRFNLSNYPLEFNFDLIREFGWYTAPNRGNNVNGVSRDHIISINDGWINGIDWRKISHPANCMLVRHQENWNKRGNSLLTESELDDKIFWWDIRYKI